MARDRFFAMPRRATLLRASLAFLALALVVFAPNDLGSARAQLTQEDVETAKANLSSVYDPIAALHEQLDRTRFDLDELALEVAFDDPEAIVQRVHERVRFEPYRGLLRGAEGTLASGGGNALDQALLVATLLRDAGFEAEIARAELNDAGVRRALATLRPAPDAPVWQDAEVSGLEGDPEELTRIVEERRAQLVADTEQARAALDGTLANDAAAATMEAAREATRDYFWVRYRQSSAEPWQDGHPVFGERVPEVADLEPSDTFAESIPPELQHRLRVQAFVEQRLGDEIEVHPVMDAWERPVANLYGRSITYASVPDGLEGADDPSDPEQVRAETSFLFPTLLGDMAPGAQAFEMNGNVTPPEAAQSPFGGIFQTVGGDLGEAAGALGGLGGDDDEQEPADEFVALSAHWLEFTFVRPGGEEVTHRRMITDRRGAAARAEGDPELASDVSEARAFNEAASAHRFVVEPGAYGDAYVRDRGFAALLASRDLAERTLDAMAAGDRIPNPDPDWAARQNDAGGLWLYDLFGDAPVDEDGLVSYRPEPALVVLSQRLDGERNEVDVIANPRWSFRAGDDEPRADPAVTQAFGAWETRVEGLALSESDTPATPAYAALEEAGGDLEAIAPGDLDAVAALDAPSEVQAAVREDVSGGYAVLAPQPMGDDAAVQGWWRVDPSSGETLGRGGDGRGQSFTEYLTQTSVPIEVSWALTAGFTTYGVHQCTKIEDSEQAGCCIVENLALAAGGLGLGAGLAVKGADTLLMFLTFDVGVNVAGAAGALPSFCT